MNWSDRSRSVFAASLPGLFLAASCTTDDNLGQVKLPSAVVVSLAGEGTGTIDFDPAGAECDGGDRCRLYPEGTRVELEARADVRSQFSGWAGRCSGTAKCVLVLGDGDTRVVATFDPKMVEVTLCREGAGAGRIVATPPGVECVDPECVRTYRAGETVMLHAVPDRESVLAGWRGDCRGTSDCYLDTGDDRRACAVFEPESLPLDVVVSGAGSGAVRSVPPGIACFTGICTGYFAYGSTVTLSAVAEEGSYFAGWSPGCAAGSECTLRMDRPRDVGVAFERAPRLEVIRTGSGHGVVTSSPPGVTCGAECSANFPPGTRVRLEAVASPGSELVSWSPSCPSVGPGACQLELRQDTRVEVELRRSCTSTVETIHTAECRIFLGAQSAVVSMDGTEHVFWSNHRSCTTRIDSLMHTWRARSTSTWSHETVATLDYSDLPADSGDQLGLREVSAEIEADGTLHAVFAYHGEQDLTHNGHAGHAFKRPGGAWQVRVYAFDAAQFHVPTGTVAAAFGMGSIVLHHSGGAGRLFAAAEDRADRASPARVLAAAFDPGTGAWSAAQSVYTNPSLPATYDPIAALGLAGDGPNAGWLMWFDRESAAIHGRAVAASGVSSSGLELPLNFETASVNNPGPGVRGSLIAAADTLFYVLSLQNASRTAENTLLLFRRDAGAWSGRPIPRYAGRLFRAVEIFLGPSGRPHLALVDGENPSKVVVYDIEEDAEEVLYETPSDDLALSPLSVPRARARSAYWIEGDARGRGRLLSATICPLVPAGPPPTIGCSGTILCYPLDGDTDTRDASGNDVTLENHDARKSTDRFGRADRAYAFNGMSYLGAAGVSMTLNDFTASLWVLEDEAPAWYMHAFAIHSGGPGTRTGDRGLSISVGNVDQLLPFLTTVDGTAEQISNHLRSRLLPGVWTHLALVREGDEIRFYENGRRHASIEKVLGELSISGGFVHVGAPNFWDGGWTRNGRDGAKWRGKIDDLRLWPHALSDREVRTVMSER